MRSVIKPCRCHQALILAVVLTGCASREPLIIRTPQEVQEVVSQGCKFEWPEKPNSYVASLLPEAKRPERLKAALVERAELKAYVPELEAILKGCRSAMDN